MYSVSVLKPFLGALTLVVLASCGGGGDGGGNGAPALASVSGNSNGSTILASGGAQVAFTSSGQLRYQDTTFTNVTLANGVVMVSGQPVAKVVLVDGTNGSKVAQLQCTNGTVAGFAGSGSSLQLTCNGVGSSSTQQGAIGIPLLSCVTTTRNAQNGFDLVNGCADYALVAYCPTGPNYVSCITLNFTLRNGTVVSGLGFSDGPEPGTLLAPGHRISLDNISALGFMACVGDPGPNPLDILPIPTSLVAGGGYCR
jgi:hypothetical protein